MAQAREARGTSQSRSKSTRRTHESEIPLRPTQASKLQPTDPVQSRNRVLPYTYTSRMPDQTKYNIRGNTSKTHPDRCRGLHSSRKYPGYLCGYCEEFCSSGSRSLAEIFEERRLSNRIRRMHFSEIAFIRMYSRNITATLRKQVM